MSDLKRADPMDIVRAAETTAERIRESYKWSKVKAPRAWYPKTIGEELVGFYGGRTVRNGPHGQYEVIIVHVPLNGSFTLSGTVLLQLIDSSMIEIGHPIRVVWQGTRPGEGEKYTKLFELLIAEGEPIPADALPQVNQ